MSNWGSGRPNQITVVWIAAYTAVVSTLAILFGIFNGKPKIEVECEPITPEPPPSGFTRRFSAPITIKATNRGDKPALITGIEYHVYFSRWAKFRQKPYATVTAGVATRDPLPWSLEPGATWEGVGQHPPGFKGRAGVYCVVTVSGSKKGVQCRM